MPPEDDIDVDALLAEIEAPEKPTEMASETAAVETPAATAAPAWDGKSWEFEWNGKKVAPESQERARTWMSQGYNYSQRMGELNKTFAQKDADIAQRVKAADELKAQFSPYADVDAYAKANPEWWKHTLAEFQKTKAGTAADPALVEALKPIQEKLQQYDQHFQGVEQQREQEAQKAYDTKLDGEIESIRKEYPNIDLTAADPSTGEPLERRIILHAQEIGTTSFRAAFRDYLHDKLLETAKANGRTAVANDAQANAKKGILGKTPAPVKGIQQANNVRGKSYNDLAAEALAEYGIT